MNYLGFNPPLYDDDNLFPFQMNLRLIKNDLIQLLKTIPGERVMMPEFGVGLQTYQFELFDYSISAQIQDAIFNAIKKYDPRLDIQDIDISQSKKQPNLIYITILGRVKNIDKDLKLSLTIKV